MNDVILLILIAVLAPFLLAACNILNQKVNDSIVDSEVKAVKKHITWCREKWPSMCEGLTDDEIWDKYVKEYW